MCQRLSRLTIFENHLRNIHPLRMQSSLLAHTGKKTPALRGLEGGYKSQRPVLTCEASSMSVNDTA
jgi:hypothetical protein